MIKYLLLSLMLLSNLVQADEVRLTSLVAGTDLTPPISGLQISLMKQGKPAGGYALGFAQVDDGAPVPLRRDHKVRVASISKLVAAIGIMQLIDAGELDLDRDVSDYLGWPLRNPAYPEVTITARQLLSHTSSLRDGPRYYISAGGGELRDFFDPTSAFWDDGAHYASAAEQKPGEFFVYANLNFGVLGELVERIAGQRFDLYMTEHVLVPLGLSARFNPCEITQGQLASAFLKRLPGEDWAPSGPWVPQVDADNPTCYYGADNQANSNFLNDYVLGSNASLFSPQGGLRASADDLRAVLSLLANGGMAGEQRLLSEHAVATMLAPEWTLATSGKNGITAGEAEPGGPTDGLMTSYGLSVHRVNMRAWGFATGPTLMLGHLGEAYGVLSQALFDPNTGDGLVAIITGTGDDPGKTPGHSPLYRVEEEVLRWWLAQHTTP